MSKLSDFFKGTITEFSCGAHSDGVILAHEAVHAVMPRPTPTKEEQAAISRAFANSGIQSRPLNSDRLPKKEAQARDKALSKAFANSGIQSRPRGR